MFPCAGGSAGCLGVSDGFHSVSGGVEPDDVFPHQPQRRRSDGDMVRRPEAGGVARPITSLLFILFFLFLFIRSPEFFKGSPCSTCARGQHAVGL